MDHLVGFSGGAGAHYARGDPATAEWASGGGGGGGGGSDARNDETANHRHAEASASHARDDHDDHDDDCRHHRHPGGQRPSSFGAAREESDASSRKRSTPCPPDAGPPAHAHRHRHDPRPRTTCGADDDRDQSNVREAASGIISLAATAGRFARPMPQNDFPPQEQRQPQQHYAATAAPNPDDAFSRLSNSAVHLSITKAEPSFVEPWRKFPPVSLVGTGAVVTWKEGDGAENGAEGTNGRRTVGEADGTTSRGGENDAAAVRILTNARSVQYATCIRARTKDDVISVGCAVEWISLAMDLALLKVVSGGGGGYGGGGEGAPPSGWSAIALPTFATADCLPRRGAEVECARFPAAASPRRSRRLGARSQFSRPAELEARRGTVAGFRADEDAHHMLRMRVNLSAPMTAVGGDGSASNGDDDGGGLVADADGRLAGIVASHSRAERSGVDVIPGVVIDRFLGLCGRDGAASPPCDGCDASASATSCHANGGHHAAAHAHTDTGGDTTSSQSEQGNGRQRSSSRQPVDEAGPNHRRCLPGIPTLGITGFQTLENASLRRSLGLAGCDENGVGDGDGVRILGINHTVHPAADNGDCHQSSSPCKEDKKCNTSVLRTDDVLLSIDDEAIRSDGTVRLAPGREDERVDLRWLAARRRAGDEAKLDVVRHKRRATLRATLEAPRHLVPRRNEGGGEEDGGTTPSYVVCGGCVFVPLTRAWLDEASAEEAEEEEEERRMRRTMSSAVARFAGGGRTRGPRPSELGGFRRYLQEQRRGDQQVIVLSHVLPDEVNVGYHGVRNAVLTSVNGQRPVGNMAALADALVKRENVGPSLEFRCSLVNVDRAKVVICMDAKEVLDSEARIMSNYAIDSWCSNALSPALKKEARGRARRHGAGAMFGLRTMRALRNSVRETTLVVKRSRPPPAASTGATPSSAAAAGTTGHDEGAVAATRRIMDFSEAHKMQSAPLFAGKYTEEGGWTQVKTKHLSQLCTCGKSTRFYCICSVGVMRCKDCFIRHCREHTGNHECTRSCPPSCDRAGVPDGRSLIAEGVELVTTKKRKRNNPTQAIQSRCAVCKAKTCYCCSACGFEKEVALCHVSTGRNCLPIHTSECHANDGGGGDEKCGHAHGH